MLEFVICMLLLKMQLLAIIPFAASDTFKSYYLSIGQPARNM